MKVRVIKRSDRPFLVMRWTDRSGQPHQRTTGTTRHREAERMASQLEAELNAPRGSGAIPWHEFRQRCERERYGKASGKTLEAFQTTANHLERVVDPHSLADLSTSELSRFAAELRDGGLAEQSIASYLGRIHASLQWAFQLKLIADVPPIAGLVVKRRTRHMRGRPLTAEEFERGLAAVPRVVQSAHVFNWRFYLRGLWLSGLRLGESLVFSWDPSDDAPHVVDIDARRPFLRHWSESEKGRQDRLLPITPDFVELLRSVDQLGRAGRVFRLPLLFGGRKRVITTNEKTVSRKVSAIFKAAGVITAKTAKGPQYATAHDLRRSFGERWAMKVRPVVLKELMRHQSLETTMKYYVGESAERTAAEVWEAFEQQQTRIANGESTNNARAE